jgi:uncharacterized protein YcfL
LSSDNIDADELTNISVHLTQSSKSRLVENKLTNISVHFRVEKYELTNRSVHFRVEKDELTNISIQSWQLREMILQTDQINPYEGIKDESTNRST